MQKLTKKDRFKLSNLNLQMWQDVYTPSDVECDATVHYAVISHQVLRSVLSALTLKAIKRLSRNKWKIILSHVEGGIEVKKEK